MKDSDIYIFKLWQSFRKGLENVLKKFHSKLYESLIFGIEKCGCSFAIVAGEVGICYDFAEMNGEWSTKLCKARNEREGNKILFNLNWLNITKLLVKNVPSVVIYISRS